MDSNSPAFIEIEEVPEVFRKAGKNYREGVTKKGAAMMAPYTSPISYLFVEVTRQAIENKLDEYAVGYTRDIHNWCSDPTKRLLTSRYVYILKVNAALGAKDIYKKLHEICQEREIDVAKMRFRDIYSSVMVPWQKLARLIGEAVKATGHKVESYRIEELMLT